MFCFLECCGIEIHYLQPRVGMVFKSVPSGNAHETDIVCVNGLKAYRLHLVRGHDLRNIL
jgi:hypothetical protein